MPLGKYYFLLGLCYALNYSPYSESASCTHVAALLHALCGLTPSTFSLGLQGEQATEEEFVPITSQLCKWNVPRK